MIGRVKAMNWEDSVVADLNILLQHLLEGVQESNKYFTQDDRSPRRDLKPGRHEY
jgi:hypothetical protein